ncbi:histidine phosphatase family protein [Pseudomonas viridiflava]|uniref:lipopolysaccharide core heptose(II)-phosphate phosphatase PmrG n=1 Tax=Pseudomonas viridiflava TaxID=33069 RepID=UPI0015E3A2CF|nr:histidine phosphatase family protein [Pseudomonas viridiflava]MBA1228626.1 histidine phosphatase family protein [Pseudomonas viridiflava]
MLVVVAIAAVGVWFMTAFKATHVADLGASGMLKKSGLYARWKQGEVVVMIRHAERCDRSTNPCMADAQGITLKGSESALAVGEGLRRLGFVNARMITSPRMRTQQTADLISGHAVANEAWPNDCNGGFNKAVQAHKVKGENLILVTHSGCIDQFERKLGVPFNERSSAYAQAVFVQVDGIHTPKILGSLNARQWADLDSEQMN